MSNVGLLHPCHEETGRRVLWTAEEIQIVGKFCTQHPESINVVSMCLKFIMADPNIRQHFHPHHIADSTRLRWGWEKYKKQN